MINFCLALCFTFTLGTGNEPIPKESSQPDTCIYDLNQDGLVSNTDLLLFLHELCLVWGS
jgi:hypothetical protein